MLLPRVLTAIVLIALVAAALFGLRDLPFALVALILPVVGAWEWAGLSACSRSQRIAYTLATAVLGLLLALMPVYRMVWGTLFLLATVFWLFIAPLWLWFQWKMRIKWLALAVGWLLLFAAWQGILVWHAGYSGDESGAGAFLLGLMIVVWIADSAAYFCGRLFGRHKLAPSISPGKTWEGAAGALLAVTAYVFWVVLRHSAPQEVLSSFSLYFLLFLTALLLTAVSIVGDLLESMFKRQAGVKDSGRILPGHGGLLDRVDSLIAVLAVAGAARWLLNH